MQGLKESQGQNPMVGQSLKLGRVIQEPTWLDPNEHSSDLWEGH